MTAQQWLFPFQLSELNAAITPLSIFSGVDYGFNNSILSSLISSSSSPIVVNTSDDELNIDQKVSLREAIQAANATPWDDVIVLNPGTYSLSLSGRNEDLNATGDFDILGGRGQTTIVGLGQGNNDVVIDAKGLDRIFQILPDAALTLEKVTIIGGDAELGGAILNGGTLTIQDAALSNNSASSGGAIYNFLGNISGISNAAFSNNSAQYGGAIYSIFSSNPNNKTIGFISNSTFLNNSAQYGGAIFNYIGSTIGSISNSTFSQNSSQYYGKDIYNFLGNIDNLAQIYEVNIFSERSSNTVYPNPRLGN